MSRPALLEDPFRPVVKRQIEALRGVDFAQAPPLLGFVSTKRGTTPRCSWFQSGAPVLVRWQYGLG